MISVIWNSDSVIAGRISALSPLFGQEAGRPPAQRHGVAATERRQPAEDHREDEDQQDADQERRQRYADQRDRQQQLREPRVAPERRVDAGRDAEHQRQQRRDEGELERRRQALLEQGRHLASLAQRQPEVALHRAADEAAELHVKRQVEPEIGAQPRALFLRRVLPDHERHRVAGEIEQAERDERHHRHDGERLEDAADDEGEHGKAAALAPGVVKDRVATPADDA